MRRIPVIALVLALSGPAMAEDQVDTLAYIASLQAQRTNALNAQALAEGQREWLRSQLTKAQAELAELKKKLEEPKPPSP